MSKTVDEKLDDLGAAVHGIDLRLNSVETKLDSLLATGVITPSMCKVVEANVAQRLAAVEASQKSWSGRAFQVVLTIAGWIAAAWLAVKTGGKP